MYKQSIPLSRSLSATLKPILRAVILIGTALAIFGCANRNNVVQNAPPADLYKRAHKLMTESNYQESIKTYLELQSRYPFAPQTRQAELDLIYAYYMSKQPASAIDAAEQFERENPTHPRVDYALYMKGVIYFDQTPNALERLFNIDLTKRPPKDTMKSFAAFQALMRRFPDSPYAADAGQRLIFLRDRLAAYENHVATYYMERGAYVAAVDRAKYAIQHYPESPQLKQSMQIMVNGYHAMGMDDLAADAQRVYELNYGEHAATADVNN